MSGLRSASSPFGPLAPPASIDRAAPAAAVARAAITTNHPKGMLFKACSSGHVL
jgi:hypothetical protein